MKSFIICTPKNLILFKRESMRWVGHVERVEEKYAYGGLVGKPEGKRPVGRPKHRWQDDIELKLQES
jgi:hypothetical protein